MLIAGLPPAEPPARVSGSAWLVPDGQIPEPYRDFSEPVTRLRSGEAAQRSLVVPADTTPGSYRLTASTWYQSRDAIVSRSYLSEPFEVTAP